MDPAIAMLIAALGPTVLQLGAQGLTALIGAIQGSRSSPEDLAQQVMAQVDQSEAASKAAGASIDAAIKAYVAEHGKPA